MGSQVTEHKKRKIVIRTKPEEKSRPTAESWARLRQAAEGKGWIRKK